MDTSKKPTMESGDWRGQLHRQHSVNNIFHTLKRHLPFSRYEKLKELNKIAERVEDEVYKAATSQSQYSRRICLHMLTMESRLQNHMSYPMGSSSAANGVKPSAPIDSTAQTSNSNGGDWQEEVYQKIHHMKNLYLQALKSTAYSEDSNLEYDDWRVQLPAGSRKSVVNKIMDIFTRNTPLTGDEELQELKGIAVRSEERIYISATSQSEYLRKTSFKMITNETRSQDPLSDPMHSNSTANWVTLVSTATMFANPNGRNRKEISGSIGGPIAQSTNWRAHDYQADSRLCMLNMISDTLKRLLPPSGHQGLQEVRKLAVWFEEKVYATAKSQSEYLRKLSLQMLSLVTAPQIIRSNSMPPNTAANSINPYAFVPLNYTGQTSNPNGGDRQEEVNQKDARGAVGDPVLESGDWRAQVQAGFRQRMLNKMFDQMKRHCAFSGPMGILEVRQNIQSFEERMYTTSTSQSDYIWKIDLKIHAVEVLSQSKSAANRVNPSVPSSSTAQTGHPDAEDWKEEVYQKIKAMKDLYLLDLNNFYQKVLSKLQMHDSKPQQPKNEEVEKLEVFKDVLESCMRFLQVPKNQISASYKDKLSAYEKQIITFVNSQHLQQSEQTDSQLTQVQSHENQQQNQVSSANLTTQVQQSHPELHDQVTAPHLQKRLCPQKRAMPEASSTRSGNPNDGDWQEEVDRKHYAAASLSEGSNAQQNMMDSLPQVSSGSEQQNAVNSPDN